MAHLPGFAYTPSWVTTAWSEARMCGIFGIVGHDEAAIFTALGLHALQHRGQEAAGILSRDAREFHIKKFKGLVGDRLTNPNIFRMLPGSAAIGHTRYSTTGASTKCNIQPFFATMACGRVGIVHNGNLTNAQLLRTKLERDGAIFSSTTDTEVILHLIARSKEPTMHARIQDALSQVIGAYSLLILTDEGMYAIRDPNGIRPLVHGVVNETSVFASETVALDILDVEYRRDIAPGELFFVAHDGTRKFFGEYGEPKSCLFEYVYFARPDSSMSHPLHELLPASRARRRLGEELAKEQPCVTAEAVIPVLDSGFYAALGYADASDIPFVPALTRNHYVGRTFIEPEDGIRHLGVRLKHNPNRLEIAGKSIVLIDDSLVRGTTSMKIVRAVRDVGAREVHVRISCPPTMHPCFHGIDTPDQEQLLAASRSVAEMCRLIGADSLGFLTLEGMYRAVTGKTKKELGCGFCDACWTGEYPTPIPDRVH